MRRKVLSRCAANHQARARLALSATISKSTSPAPTNASVSISTIAACVASQVALPRGVRRRAQTSCTTTNSSATPEVARCASSISVSTAGSRGMTTPLQSGQCAPHPAPDPEART